MKEDEIKKELNYLLELQEASCHKYGEIKKQATDIQLQDFLEVTTRHRKELIQELKNKMDQNSFPVGQKNQIQLSLQELDDTFLQANTKQLARKIAEVEKKLVDRYKEVQAKALPDDIKALLKKHVMTLEEIYLQADVLARLV